MEQIGCENRDITEISLPEVGTEAIRLPRNVLEHMTGADELYIKTLLFLLSYENLEKVTVEDLYGYISAGLNNKSVFSRQKMMEALFYWQNKGVVSLKMLNPEGAGKGNVTQVSETVPADKSRSKGKSSCRIDEICSALESRSDFRELIQRLQDLTNDIFNPAEITIVYNMFVNMQAPAGLVLKIAEICLQNGKKSIQYIEKAVTGFINAGIDTAEKYDAHLQEKMRLLEIEEEASLLFKITDRALTSKERAYIKKWWMEYNFSSEVINEGHNLCLNKTGKTSFGYMNAIFESWYSKGFKTINDIKNEFNKNPADDTVRHRSSNFDIEQFFNKAIKAGMSRE